MSHGTATEPDPAVWMADLIRTRRVRLKAFASIWKTALSGWWNDNVPRLGASLSYYTLFSAAPIIIIAIAIAGSVFGEKAVQGQVAQQLDQLLGPVGAKAVESVLVNARQPGVDTTLASVLAVLTFLVGATSAFLELESALDDVWKVKAKLAGKGFRGMVLQRFVSFGLVVAVGFLLLVSLVVSTALTALGAYLQGRMPLVPLLWQGINLVFSLVVVALLFALVYKVLPNVVLRWRDVWVGAFVTALLFSVGKFLIGLYLGRSTFASTYGAAGSVVVLLAWIYYTSQVVLLGAEFTKAYSVERARRRAGEIAGAATAAPVAGATA